MRPGRNQLPLTTMCIFLGRHVRVGLEEGPMAGSCGSNDGCGDDLLLAFVGVNDRCER